MGEAARRDSKEAQGTLAISERSETLMLLNFRRKDTGVSPAQD